MTVRRRALLWLTAALLINASTAAVAQTQAATALPGAPSWPRFVVDLRGATSGIPSDVGFYPPLPDGALVPARGFGLDVGGHVYFGKWGPVRLGGGANLVLARATEGEAITVTERLLAPQLSFNFGSPLGWSYVSGGVGTANIEGRSRNEATGETRSRSSETLRAFNVGAGARWFFSDHLAFTFDLRFHRIGAGGGEFIGTGADTLGSASVGLSFK